MKFYLNNKEIKVLNGSTFSLKKDETLDSGKIELVFSDDDTPILPMSLIKIEDNGETYNFLVINDIVEVASKKPKAYLHTITFAQNTKKFSKIQVRNTQFSQPAKNSLKCGCNKVFENEDNNGYMFNFYAYDGEGYSYSMEVSNRHKVKNAYIEFKLYHAKNLVANDGNYQNTIQDTCPSLKISFDIYKDNTLYLSYSGIYSNGDISYLNNSLDSGVYTIKNVKVVKLGSSYSDFDLFIVNIALVCNVYYYSLYDVLDILRKQIALQELKIETLSAPNISLENVFNETTKQYDIYARITNTNNSNVIATYWSEGAVLTSKTTSNLSSYEGKRVYIGATKSGLINVFTYLENTAKTSKSTTVFASISYDANIVNPNLTFASSENNSYHYEISNPNSFAVNVFGKYWKSGDSSQPSEFTKLGVLNTNEKYTSQDFSMTKLYVECYFTKVNEEAIKSETIKGNKFIPPVLYNYDLYLSDLGKEGVYSLKSSNQFQSDVDYNYAIDCWRYIEDNFLYDISEYTMNGTTSSFNGEHFILYGYKTPTVLPPSMSVRSSYAGSGKYDIYVKFTNVNTVSCKVYYSSFGALSRGNTLVGTIASKEKQEIYFGSVSSNSSGRILAYCVYETITSKTKEETWSESAIIPTYTLTVKYYKSGLQYESEEFKYDDGTTININNYVKEYTGYKLSYTNPKQDFTLTSHTYLHIYYNVIATHDYQFEANVVRDDTFIMMNGAYQMLYTLISSSMNGDYESIATYSVQDVESGEYLDNATLRVLVNHETGVLSGDTTHNNASDLIRDYGSGE